MQRFKFHTSQHVLSSSRKETRVKACWMRTVLRTDTERKKTKLSSEIIARGATAYCVQRSDRFPGLLILLAFLEMLSKKVEKGKRLRSVEMKKGASLWNTSRALQRKRRACPLGTLLGTMPAARCQRDTNPPGWVTGLEHMPWEAESTVCSALEREGWRGT